jgi:hypothetical protein
MAGSAPGSELREQLADWVAQGLIDAGHAARIEAAETARPVAGDAAREVGVRTTAAVPSAAVRRLPLAVEALGYLGTIAAVVAGLITTRQLWPTVSAGAVLTFTGAAAIVLLLAGAVLRTDDSPPFGRLRSVLWLTSTVSQAVFAGLLTGPRFWSLGPVAEPLVAEAAVTAYAAVLWWRCRSTLQHVAVFAATAALVMTGIAKTSPGIRPWGLGLGLWVLSLLWIRVVHRGTLLPRTAGYVATGVGLLVGAQLTMETAAGQALAVATAAGLLTAGVVLNRVLLLGLGAVGAVVTLPRVLAGYLPAGAVTAAAVFAVGLVMLGVALWLARSRTKT